MYFIMLLLTDQFVIFLFFYLIQQQYFHRQPPAMNIPNRFAPLNTPLGQMHINLTPSHASVDKHGHRHAKSLLVQNQLVDQLKMKIMYLNQQISQYKHLVKKLENQLKQKSEKLDFSTGIINNPMVHQKINKSMTRSLNKSEFLPKRVIDDMSPIKYESRKNSVNNICILEDVVKVLDVHCCQQVLPMLKQKLKRLAKLENFAECISSLRVAFGIHVQKSSSLKSNWKWIKQIVEKKETISKIKSPTSRLR